MLDHSHFTSPALSPSTVIVAMATCSFDAGHLYPEGFGPASEGTSLIHFVLILVCEVPVSTNILSTPLLLILPRMVVISLSPLYSAPPPFSLDTEQLCVRMHYGEDTLASKRVQTLVLSRIFSCSSYWVVLGVGLFCLQTGGTRGGGLCGDLVTGLDALLVSHGVSAMYSSARWTACWPDSGLLSLTQALNLGGMAFKSLSVLKKSKMSPTVLQSFV